MKNKLTFALLFAGLFLSIKSYAAGECLGYSGSIVDLITFPPGSSCPEVTAKTVSGVECELVKTGTFLCSIFDDGSSTISGPWRYTGNLFGGETDPDPDDPTNPIYTELNEMGWLGRSADCSATDDTCRRLSNQVLFNFQDLGGELVKLSQNDNVINTNVVTLSSRMAQFIANVSSAKSSADAAKASSDLTRDAVNITNQTISNFKSELLQSNDSLSESLAEVKTLSEDLQLTAAEDSLRNEQLHQQTHDTQEAAQTALDAMAIVVENGRYHAQNAASMADSANYNAQQAYNMASEAAYNSGYLMGDVSDTKNMTSEMLNLMLEGGTGGSGDLEQTNDILNGIKSDANNNTDRILNAVNNSIALANIETQIMQTNGKLGGLSGQLGQQLDEIKTAVENIDTGGGTGGPATDTGTHERLDTLNTKVFELNENVVDSALNTQQAIDGSTDELLAELVAIKGALEDGTSEYDDTEVKEKLTALINNTGAIGNNVVTSGQSTQQAVAASGQQVTDAVNGLGEKLDGINESIDGLGNAFEAGSGQNTGPTLCTGDDCYKGKSWITPKYPEGITSIYEDHKAKFQASSIHEYMQGFVPNLSGSAPNSWEFCINFDGMANLGCHTVELPPYVISFVRLIILISAGFLCRRLIFGG